MLIALIAAGITVANPAELAAALKNAKGGERISLRPGNYGQVIVQNRTWWNAVTVESADPARPATIAKLVVRDTTGMNFNNIEFTRPRAAEPYFNKMVEVSGGAYIRFNGGSVHGSLNQDPTDDMQGMMVRASTGFAVSNMTFTDLQLGLSCDDCVNFGIQGNMFTYIGSDAIDIPRARSGRIQLNTFRDFRPMAAWHPDAIQCWTSGKATGCKDVTIFRNTFQSDPGHEFQGVMFGDEAGVGGYDRITIQLNTFSMTMWNAINIARGADIAILDNRISAGPTMRPWIRTASPVSVKGNVAPAYLIEGKQGVPAGNTLGGAFKK